MLNDIREPPLERHVGDHSGSNPPLDVSHPVLAPDGDPIADVELYHHSIPDHALTGGVALAMLVGIFALILAAMMWVWMA